MREIERCSSRHMQCPFRRYNLIQRNVADATKIMCIHITYLIRLQKYIKTRNKSLL